jgi:excisionase family DNA binding protein
MTNEVQTLANDVPGGMLLKPVELAVFLGVSAKTVYRWCDMGLMESVKLNGSVRVLRNSVISFLRKADRLA